MNLTKIGQIVARCWLALPRHFENVTLDAWVLMPDHTHGIITIHNVNNSTMAAESVMRVSSKRPNGTRQGSLNAIVQNFKSISTRKVNQLHRTPNTHLWQRDYYERIIRHERALNAARNYIDENPAKYSPY